jgi:5-formyltetrahydrofolate cyclo-ligase
MPGEPDLLRWLRSAIATGKDVFLPSISDGRMRFLRWTSEDLAPGTWGLREPDPTAPEIAAADLDLVLVPGVAFDEAGGRLGMGKAYYDQALCGVERPRIGVAWEWQIVAELPTEPHDVPMTALCTEHAFRDVALQARA